VLGTDNVDCQLGDGLPAELVLGLPRATIDEACDASAVVLMGPDLKEELPILYLRLREVAAGGKVKLVELSPHATGLSALAAARLQHRPGDAAAVVRAMAAEQVPADGAGGVSAADIGRAVDVLGDAERVVVVLGRASVAESDESVVDAAGVLAAALPDARFLPVLRRANVHGALDMGLAPGVLPGRVSLDEGRARFGAAWGSLPERRGLDAAGILRAAVENRIQGLVLVGADPLADFPDRGLARRALAGVGFTVVVDLYAPAVDADVVLPAAGFGERPGTTTNMEGRVSRLGQKVTPPGTARPDWMIAAELARRLGADMGLTSLDEIAAEIERLAPSHAGLTPALLARASDGVVVPLSHTEEQREDRAREGIEMAATRAHLGKVIPESDADADAPLQPLADPVKQAPPEPPVARPPLLRFAPGPATRSTPPVDAYSLRLVSGRRLFDGGTLVTHSPSLAQLASGPCLRANPSDLGRLGVTTGDRVRVSSSRASLVLEAVADRHVMRGSAVLDFNQPGEGAAELIDSAQPVTDLRVETVGTGASGRERGA
jgi:NADH-quinone oxidoreductase subunit G